MFPHIIIYVLLKGFRITPRVLVVNLKGFIPHLPLGVEV